MIQSFVGTWRLESFELRKANGQVNYPFGLQPLGYIMYTRNGYMSVSFMSADRLRFASADPQGGTAIEKASVMESFISYCGKYEVKESTVLHHIEVSAFPNWIGEVQERSFEFEGSRLKLSTLPFVREGVEQTAHLVWELVES